MVQELIKRQIEELESKHGIKILFAVEAGSRLWRMASEDSDYDIRFVFVQPLSSYISINAPNNMERVINHQMPEHKLDFVGFDLFKFCRLLAKSNPSVIEWLQSDIKYHGQVPKDLQRLAHHKFNPNSLRYHYFSMCRQNYHKYLKSQQLVTYKKYLYAMRGLLNAKWVEEVDELSLPPISFPQLIMSLRATSHVIPLEILDELEDMVNKKITKQEKDIVKNVPRFDDYIESELAKPRKDVSTQRMNSEVIDYIIRKILNQSEKGFNYDI